MNTTNGVNSSNNKPRITIPSSTTSATPTTSSPKGHYIHEYSPSSPRRPSFCSRTTSDRLQESARVQSFRLCTLKTEKKERRSVFRELGLEDEDIQTININEEKGKPLPVIAGHNRSASESNTDKNREQAKLRKEQREKERYTPALGAVDERKPWYSKLTSGRRPQIRSASSAPTGLATLPRVAMIAFLLALVIPGFLGSGKNGIPADGANAGVIKARDSGAAGVWKREDSTTDTCTRWSHQAAVLNGTLYIYGGQSKAKAVQEEDTWNSNFLTLDLSKSWEKTSPPLKGLPKPDGPPAVSNGYLWNSYSSLYLYGGLYSDKPPQTPDPVSVWEYNIPESKWREIENPKTSDGNFSQPAGQPLQRSAEGAGLSVPELGLSWYFGGHQDMYTTRGWSNQIARVYLTSMLEFTHPGYMNTGVRGLGVGEAGAGKDGAFRNITQGGLQDTAGFTERADGVLVYVPGWGESGIVLGLAGGISVPEGDEGSYTDMSTIDIYDVATSRWYKQSTSGTPPGIRVNPCAVVFAAPDASSFNVYLYGGQNLYPYGEQKQYDDVWILTIPSFSWVKVDTSSQATPPARAGHTCHAWDGQMVVVGGYVGKDLSCDSPGIYVFNASSLEWASNFNAVPGSVTPSPINPNGVGSGSSSDSRKGISDGGDGEGENKERDGEGFIYAGLAGSNGYTVPEPVIKLIGGGASGSATITAPAAGTPSDGPIATGKAPVFTITAPGTTVTSQSTSTAAPNYDPSVQTPGEGKGGKNVPAIAAGVVAGVLACLAAYLAFCTWLYRRQLKLYKDHVAMAQRAAFTGAPGTADGTEKVPGSSGAGGAPIVGAFGTVVGRTSSSQGEPRSSLASSAGGGLGGGVTRPDLIAKGGRTETGQTGVGGTTDEGYLAGASGESEGPDSGRSSFDSLGGMEPNFFSVVMSPRRTLRVINRD